MGRGKVVIKKIENPTNRQVTFSKRRMGLLKKAKELAILCDAQVGVIIFSGSGKMYEYSSPPWRIVDIFDRFLKAPNTRFEEIDIHQKFIHELTRMKDENNSLKVSMRQYMGEDLTSTALQELINLEQQIASSLEKVRLRKQQLLDQQLLEMHQYHREMHISEHQNNYFCHIKQGREHYQAVTVIDQKQFPLWDLCSQFYGQDAESSMTALQLSPQLHEYKLQPVQPNLQDTNLHGHGLRLW